MVLVMCLFASHEPVSFSGISEEKEGDRSRGYRECCICANNSGKRHNNFR
ncbi:MAG: hypothetical protein K9K75_04725 [Deltaproteobacteria bacterium]|nr:hypothetical protein [Deltaproteobacteria bacterium]